MMRTSLGQGRVVSASRSTTLGLVKVLSFLDIKGGHVDSEVPDRSQIVVRARCAYASSPVFIRCAFVLLFQYAQYIIRIDMTQLARIHIQRFHHHSLTLRYIPVFMFSLDHNSFGFKMSTSGSQISLPCLEESVDHWSGTEVKRLKAMFRINFDRSFPILWCDSDHYHSGGFY